MAITMTPAMTNQITGGDGQRYNIMIVPDKNCTVNQGLSSTRGGKMASVMYTSDGIGRERLLYPRLYTGDQWLDTTWDQALAIYGELVKKIIDKDGPSDVMFPAACSQTETVTLLRGSTMITLPRPTGSSGATTTI